VKRLTGIAPVSATLIVAALLTKLPARNGSGITTPEPRTKL
jgi:hypothetical protein